LPSAGAGFTVSGEWRFPSPGYRREKVIMGNKIFVGGLNWDATDDDLRETFGECGAITDAVVVNDRDTGRSRGFGFVTYSSDEEAKAAVEKFDGQDFMGRKLTVNEARQREERGDGGGGGGGYGGGGGGRGGGGRGGGGGRSGGGGGRRDNW
jgi:RNA recognition motif-containing protein